MSEEPVERNLKIEQAQLRGFARSFSEVEWLLLILVVLYLFGTQTALARDGATIGVLLAFAAFILLFRYSKLFAQRTSLKITLEILVMVAFLTAVLSASGGQRSPLVNLYLLPIITAALALGKRATALVMALVIGAYLLLATLDAGIAALNTSLWAQAAGVLFPFVMVAFLTTLLADNLHTAKNRIRAISDRDELTMLYNQRAFTRLAEREHEYAVRSQQHYSILMVDIEHLKVVNDTYGHEAGNRAIKMVGDALSRLTRSSDIVAHYGGDEFVIYLAGADTDVADEVAQRIRNVIFSTTLEVDAKIVRLKVNVGVGSFSGDGATLQDVMTKADRAMYKDKEFREPPKGKLIIQKR